MSETRTTSDTTDDAAARERFWRAESLKDWAKIGLISFGGPAGQIALMHRVVVEERGWLDERRFLGALNFCMLLPGPEAQQLATYVGWLKGGRLGGLIAGGLFILPGALLVFLLSALYLAFGALPAIAALFAGLKAAVLALVLQALLRLAGKALKDGLARGLAVAAFLALFLFAVPFPLVVLAAGLCGFLLGGGGAAETRSDAQAAPSLADSLKTLAGGLALWFAPVAALALLLGPDSAWVALGLFFAKMAVVTFGGAYAVLAYVAQEAVSTHGWLSPGQMLDGLGLAETTPGPLILVVEFVGALAGAKLSVGLPLALAAGAGALLVLWVTFVPCFLWIFLGAPYVERLQGQRRLSGALAAITAAVVGVIANLALWFALQVLFRETTSLEAGPLSLLWPELASLDWRAALLTLVAVVALLKARLALGWVLLGAALGGLLLYGGLV